MTFPPNFRIATLIALQLFFTKKLIQLFSVLVRNLNVRNTFGEHCFLANSVSRHVIDLNDEGCPSPPLKGECLRVLRLLLHPEINVSAFQPSSPSTLIHLLARHDACAVAESEVYSLLSSLPGPLPSTIQKKTQKRERKARGDAQASEPEACVEEIEGACLGADQNEAKLKECTTWLAAAKRANAGLRTQIRRMEENAGGRAADDKGEAWKGEAWKGGEGDEAKRGGSGTYGFEGKIARPKDEAKAQVLGEKHQLVKSAPSLSSQVDGGGVEWHRQPVVGFKPIGYFEGCFKEKNGTPRQGNISRGSRGRLKILFSNTPEQTTMGLDQYTHCWVLWLFHDNGNRAVRPLVHPPRLDGAYLFEAHQGIPQHLC